MSTQDEPTQTVLPENDPMRFMSPEARDLFAASIFERKGPRPEFTVERPVTPALPREERDAIRARAEAATDGPWRTWNDGHVGSPTVHIGGGVMPTPGSDPAQRMPDAEFIAHARTDVPALLDALDAAEAEVERLRENRDECHRAEVAYLRRLTDAEDERDALAAQLDRLRAGVEGLANSQESAWRNSWYCPQEDDSPPQIVTFLRALLAEE